MTTIDTSYQLGTFRDNEGSLARLKRQAASALDLEFAELRAAGFSAGQRVLDVGCGPGIIASELAGRGEAKEVVAVDCNESSIKAARDLFDSLALQNVSLSERNVYDPDAVPGAPFDFAYARLLLQHLSEPIFALTNIRKSLAPNGRLCVCDVDDRWLTVAPEVPSFAAFIERVGVSQQKRGGDRNVGGKLAHYMRCAGYTDIRSRCLLISTDIMDKEKFCDLVLGYKEEVVPQDELPAARVELKEIRETVATFQGWAGLALFFVSGRPGEAQ